jgi:hypothetical protein
MKWNEIAINKFKRKYIELKSISKNIIEFIKKWKKKIFFENFIK